MFAAWQKLNDADGVIPYLDYTTPTFYDDITGAIQELLAGKQRPGRRSPRPCRTDYDEVRRRRAERLRGSPDDRPPGEPRRVGYLYLLPAFAVFALFVLAPLLHAAWLSLFTLGRR